MNEGLYNSTLQKQNSIFVDLVLRAPVKKLKERYVHIMLPCMFRITCYNITIGVWAANFVAR